MRVLERAPVLVHFCKKGRRGNARTIADAVLAAEPAREYPLVYPYTTELHPEHPDYVAALAAFYDDAAGRLADHLGAGRDVAILSRGRSVLLRLVHAPVAAPEGPLPRGGRARRHRHVRLLDPGRHPDHLGRRRAHRAARHPAARRPGGAPARHRRRRADEARAPPAEGAGGAGRGRRAGARGLCRARHHGGRAGDRPHRTSPTTWRPTSRWCSCPARDAGRERLRHGRGSVGSSASAPAIRAC